MSKGSLGKPIWFEHTVAYAQNENVALLIDMHGPAAYGIHWLLQEFLATQVGYKGSLKMLPGLARRFNATLATLKAVVFDSGLYAIQNEEFFVSPDLLILLEAFDQKCIEQKIKADIGVKKRAIKLLQDQKNLEETLSGDDSSKPWQSSGKAVAEPNTIQNKTKQKKKINKTTTDDYLNEWLNLKAKNKINAPAYAANLKIRMRENETSVVHEFEAWKKNKIENEKENKDFEILKTMISKKIKTENGEMEISSCFQENGKIKICFKDSTEHSIVENIQILQNLAK